MRYFPRIFNRLRCSGGCALSLFLAGSVSSLPASAQTKDISPPWCKIQSTVYAGWQAKEISNPWVKLVMVPQLGGRVMQVLFNGHAYLFVNPKYRGQYFPPVERDRKSVV